MKIEEVKCSVCPKKEINIDDLTDFICLFMDLAFESFEKGVEEEPNERKVIKEAISIYMEMEKNNDEHTISESSYSGKNTASIQRI